MQNQEKSLIEAAKHDKTQFIKLYDKYFQEIYNYLVTRVPEVALAEDIASQTFCIALEKIDSFVWIGKPIRAWFYRIAINELNKYYRASKLEREKAIQAWYEDSKYIEGVHEQLKEKENADEKAEMLKKLHVAFESLKEDDRTILSLKFFQDLSYKEIGEILGLEVNYVGVKLNRALNNLSKIL